MRNPTLEKINFREIVDYGGQPPVQYRYTKPLACLGYCIDCEESGTLGKAGGQLSLMSHGCDSADFETILKPLRRTDADVEAPVLFLLENPGSDDFFKNGETREFRGAAKKPPVNHYYWTPPSDTWPERISDFIEARDFYGSYFAYLMNRHRLVNVYITNLVKCKWKGIAGSSAGTEDPSLVTRHCADRHLTRELNAFDPRLVICFGDNAYLGFQAYAPDHFRKTIVAKVLHPAYIKNRSQTDSRRRSKQELFEENDREVQAGLAQMTGTGLP